ncbi:PTS transporter subunit IIC [Avibacterium paragallinarum]|uniref:PTS transporter subunit IIC n=1 Tax=Avibacterium paragallinarum TaxID=728 RepID=UPI0006150CD0|nr:PTS transporter subunit IIC [Avibacterium paragallinarum]KAA6208619.1 hypothetical protein F1968_08390 [Avibacterium paragallinarum]KKB01713.1 hypothetical protein Z012_04945 [Avibacterium paragallinarum]RZN70051.1 hypothetical protein EIG77_09075 [Avibacterium paragallinarum]
METIMHYFGIFNTQVLSKAPFLLGIVACLGYILLKKDTTTVIKGTIKTIVGFMIVQAGAGFLVTNFKPVIAGLSKYHNLTGAVIDPYTSMQATIQTMADNYGWVGYAVIGALFFPPILQGIVSVPGFFFVILALALVYMFFASRQLRADEAAAAAAGKTLEQMDGYGNDEVEQELVAETQANSAMGEKPVRILAVCGSGQGSSMMMKMKIKGYLDKRGIPNIMDSCAVTDYKGKLDGVDIIVCSKHLADEINGGERVAVLGVQNMLNPNSFGDELQALIEKYQQK